MYSRAFKLVLWVVLAAFLLVTCVRAVMVLNYPVAMVMGSLCVVASLTGAYSVTHDD